MTVSCYACGERGHLSRECSRPKRNQLGSTEDKVCYRCKQPGHWARDCPNRKLERARRYENYNSPQDRGAPGAFRNGDRSERFPVKRVSWIGEQSQTLRGNNGREDRREEGRQRFGRSSEDVEIRSNSRDYRRQEGEERSILQEERRYRYENGGREIRSMNMNIRNNGGFYRNQETSMEYRDPDTAPKRGRSSPNSEMVGGIRIRRVTPIRMINVSKPRSVAKTSKGGVASIESRKQESRREWGKWLRKVMLFYRRTDSQSNRIRVVEQVRHDGGDFKASKKQKKKKKRKERKSQEEDLREEQKIEANPRSRASSVDDTENCIKVEDMETKDEDTSLLLQELDRMKQVVKMLAEKLQSYLGESQKAGLEFILRDAVKDVRSGCEENQRKKLQKGSELKISMVDDTILWPSREDDVSRTYHRTE